MELTSLTDGRRQQERRETREKKKKYIYIYIEIRMQNKPTPSPGLDDGRGGLKVVRGTDRALS